MADITANDVTVTIVSEDITGKRRQNEITLAFGDGALTYPVGGVPMPTASKLGMRRNLNDLILTDAASTNGLIYKYDKTNNKIKIFEADYPNAAEGALIELDATDTPAAATLKGYALGW